jgi:hypothetical protein
MYSFKRRMEGDLNRQKRKCYDPRVRHWSDVDVNSGILAISKSQKRLGMNSHPQPLEGTMPSNIFFFFCSTGV